MEQLRAAFAQLAPLAQQPHLLATAAAVFVLFYVLVSLVWDALAYAAIPTLDVPLKQEELAEQLDAEKYTPPKTLPKDKIPCYDPGTMQFLGYAKAMTPDEVRAALAARAADRRCAPLAPGAAAGRDQPLARDEPSPARPCRARRSGRPSPRPRRLPRCGPAGGWLRFGSAP